MVDREYIRTRARYWRPAFAEDSRLHTPIATAWREERERRTGSARPYNGRGSHRSRRCRGRMFCRLSETLQRPEAHPCHDPQREAQFVERYPEYAHIGAIHTFDDWGNGPLCVRCGKPKEVGDD